MPGVRRGGRKMNKEDEMKKSDMDAPKEAPIGEPTPLTVEELMYLSGNVFHFAENDETDDFLKSAYVRFGEAAIDLAARLSYVGGCEND
jgi:hypothetical protein